MPSAHRSIRRWLRGLLTKAGKRQKVVAVFGFCPEACHAAVLHVRSGAPDIPVWLFATAPPLEETAGHCDRIFVRPSALRLLIEAELSLLRRWVALTVGTWTGERGAWLTKLAPFLVPPFRPLVMNGHGDFFHGNCSNVARHCGHGVSDQVRRGNDLARAYSLVVLAWVLRAVARRRWFERLHGSSSLPVAQAAPANRRIAEFVQEGDGWDGAALESMAQASDARWILWRRGGAESPGDSLVPLFSTPGTFAASPQRHFRAWKETLIPTAPFRLLQPDEATEVLAPVSDCILVDRAMLLAAGIPRTRFAESAWMLLFWKAAAAGWRCYSAGTTSPVSEQPDTPLQDAEFLWSVLSNRALRRLGPGAAADGNVVFSPRSRLNGATRGERLKVVVVSPFLPYPLSHGGAVRMYNVCAALADRVDFVLIAVREKDECVDYDHLSRIFRAVYTVDLDEIPTTGGKGPAMVRHYRSGALRELITRVSREWRPDVLQIEYTQMAGYRDCAPEVPAILVEHDVTYTLYGQLAEETGTSEAQAEYRRWLEFERRWLRVYDGVWTVSESDCALAMREGERNAQRTFVVPNGVDVRRYLPSASMAAAEVLFVGSFRHLPNLIGFHKLVSEVMPRVWRVRPDAVLRVVAGPRHEHFWSEFANKEGVPGLDPRIELHGFTEDLRPLYARAAAVAVPLTVSAGTNIKVLEAMACGKAIVSTSTGCAGLGLQAGREILISDQWEGFARGLLEVLGQEDLRRHLGAQARRTAEARFAWSGIAEEALQSYSALAPKGAARARAAALRTA